MKRLVFAFFIVMVLCHGLSAQQSPNDISYALKSLYDRLGSESDDTVRCQVNDSIRLYIDSYAKSGSVFTENLQDLRYLGQITSPDSMIKIVTWNLPLNNYKGYFYSYIIRKKSKNSMPVVYSLSSPYSQNPVLSDTTYRKSDWYGALYYDIRPVKHKGEEYWIVLGLNTGDPQITRKVIDVISFDSNDSILFGKKIFQNERLRHRVVFQYASSGMMTLRFFTDSLIVFDHLVPVSATPDNRPLYGADYSYDSYTFTNGIWAFSRNFDARNKE